MAPITIGAKNPRLRQLRRLVGRPKARSQERAFVVDGRRLVADALRSGLDVREIFAAPGSIDALEHELGLDDLIGPDVERFEVDPSVLASVLDPVNPQPIAAVVTMPDWSLADLAVPDRAILVAVELRDPGNLGTVIRTAEAAGLVGVVVAGRSVDRFSPKVVRASAGSLFRLPVVTGGDPSAVIDQLRDTGRPVVAAIVDPAAPAYDRAELADAAILIGNEPHGLPASVVSEADQAVTIPMAAGVESLNVGAAASVLCFEAARQRRALGAATADGGEKSVGQPPVPATRCPE